MIRRALSQQCARMITIVCLMLCGCSQQDGQADEPAARVSSTFEGLTATVSVARDDIGAADTVDVKIAIETPEGYAPAEFPIESFAGELDVIESRSLAPVTMEDGRRMFVTEAMLEPLVPGQYELAPFVFVAEQIEGDALLRVTTEAIPLVVRSEFDEDADPAFASNKAPRGFPPARTAMLIGVSAGGVLLIAAGAFVWWRLSRPKFVPPPPPAETTALSRLRALLDRRLVEIGEFDEFYTELSSILRHYIEDQFEARAPEQTTEEFLAEIGHSELFSSEDKALLRQFLRHCDLVKFARLTPSADQATDSVESARAFIERTAEKSRTEPALTEAVAS